MSRAVPPAIADPEGDFVPEEFATPNIKTIAEVSTFTGLPPTSQIKSLVMIADGKAVLALLRGDHQLSETKLGSIIGASDPRPAHPEEIRQSFGADAGSLGPVGVTNMRVIADLALQGRRNMITGANRNDFHLRNVTPGKDFEAEFADIRQVAPGDTHVESGEPLEIQKSVEIGHIFKLGYKYSESMGLKVTNEAGEEVTLIMGSYGIGVERLLAAAVELYHDANGMALPPSIAPFELVVTPVNIADETQRTIATRLAGAAGSAGLDILFDDRDERAGVKFKDADLIGIPWRITVGKKAAQGLVEVVERRSKETVEVPVDDAVSYVLARVQPARNAA